MKNDTKNQHGGARAGAGRKKNLVKRKARTVHLTDKEYEGFQLWLMEWRATHEELPDYTPDPNQLTLFDN